MRAGGQNQLPFLWPNHPIIILKAYDGLLTAPPIGRYIHRGRRLIINWVSENFCLKVIILPSFTFNPRHLGRGHEYDGEGKVYADQHWGTTTRAYRKVCRPRSKREMREINQDVVKALSDWLK